MRNFMHFYAFITERIKRFIREIEPGTALWAFPALNIMKAALSF